MSAIRAPSSIVILVALCGTMTLSGSAQQSQDPRPRETPTFRGAINAVRVDVIVTDGDDRPVMDLTEADFELYEDGALQELEDFTIVRIGESAREYRPSVIRTPLEEEAEALRDDVRLFLIYMSLNGVNLSRSDAARILTPLTDFVRSLNPADMVGIMDPFSMLDAVMLTRDHEGVVETIRSYGSDAVRQRREIAVLNRDFVIQPLTPIRALEAASNRLASLREGRQSIIFVGSAIWDRGFTDLAFSQLLTTLNRNNTAVYVLDPAGLTTGGGIGRTANLRAIAEQTGGHAIVNTNRMEEHLARIAEDARFHYLLSYNSPAEADGKFHPISVRVRRPGARVRARSGYWAFSTAEMIRATTRAAEVDRPVLDALASIAASRTATRAVQTWIGTARGTDGHTLVTFTWEPLTSPGDRRETPDRVTLIARTREGRVLFEGTSPDPAASGASGSARNLARHQVTFGAPSGPVDLRVSIESATGDLIDTEAHSIEVPEYTTTDTAMSTPRVFVARTIPQLRALLADEASVPAAGREFMRSDRLLVRFDAYGPEVAPRAALLDRSGAQMSPLDIAAAQTAGTHQIELGLSHLAPGDYLIEIRPAPDSADRSLIPIRVRG